MLKKLFVTAAAAAAVSVPLAGAAWADPSANDPPGAGGVPQEGGTFAYNHGAPTDDPVAPGSVFSGLATTKAPGVKMPDAYGVLIDAVIAPLLGAEPFGPTPPGVGIKTFTPGCSSGRHLTTNGTDSICS